MFHQMTIKLLMYTVSSGCLLSALPGYMDKAVYNVMYFSAEMWLHFRNVATNLIGHICSHISEM